MRYTYLDQNFLTGRNLRFAGQAGCTLIRSSEMTSNTVESTTACDNFDLYIEFATGCFTWVTLYLTIELSCVVAGRNKKVGQLCELVFCKGHLVLSPVVLVGSLEALKGLF